MSDENMKNQEPEVQIETPEGTQKPGDEKELEALKADNEGLRKELSDLKDQYLRKAADFENYRKRMQKEREESLRYANQNILQDLVGIIDDFERAIKSSESSRDFDGFHQGILLIEQQLVSTLERKYGLKRLESLGQPFNPDHHEAIARLDGPDGDNLVVVEEYQRGFHLHDRVLRTAKVKVGPAQDGASEISPETENKEENTPEGIEKE